MRHYRTGVVLLLALLASTAARAQPPEDTITLTTSGDACAAVNARQGLRAVQRIRGAIVNISETETVTVTCPMTTAIHGAVNYTDRFFARVNLHNHGLFAAEFSCVLRQMDAANNTVANYREALELETDEGGNNYASISFSVYRLVAEGGDFRLNLTCVLPPQTSISAVVMTTPILESDLSF